MKEGFSFSFSFDFCFLSILLHFSVQASRIWQITIKRLCILFPFHNYPNEGDQKLSFLTVIKLQSKLFQRYENLKIKITSF